MRITPGIALAAADEVPRESNTPTMIEIPRNAGLFEPG
jgi:hypothetical protein